MPKIGFAVSLVLAAASLRAGPCIPDTLANYIALPPAGCSVGALTVNGFSFAVLSSGGAPLIFTASAIHVTPQIGAAKYGLSFTSSGLHVSGNDFVNYLIGYTEDPEGPIRSLDDVLDDPVVSPGLGQVATLGCLGAAFSGAVCSTSTVGINVFDAGTSSQLADSVTFTGVFVLGIRNTITLNGNTSGNPANTGGSVSINGVTSLSSVIPEPGTAWAAAGALAALILARKPRLKRLQVRLERHP